MENKKINPDVLLKVENLNMLFKVRGSYFKALNDISFEIHQGDFFGVIGESGSGKSTLGKAIIKLYQPSGGAIVFDNHLISQKKMNRQRKKWMRKNIQMIFQDPMSSMNPIKNVMNIVSEPLIVNRIIQSEAMNFIYKINKVKSFFHYRFNEENFKIYNDFQKKYFVSKIKLLNKAKARIDKINIDKILNFSDAVTLVSDIVDDLTSQLKLHTESFYDLNNNQNALIDSTIKKYDDHDLEDVDLWLDEINKKIESKKLEYKFYTNYAKDKKKHEELSQYLSDQKNDFKNQYISENGAFREGAINKFLSNYRTSSQKVHSSSNKISYLHNDAVCQSHKEKYILAKKIFSQAKYLPSATIKELVLDIESFVDKKYKKIIKYVEDLEIKFFNSNVEAKSAFLQDYKNIKLQLKEIVNDDLEMKEKYFHKYFVASNNIHNEFQLNVNKIVSDINKIDESIKRNTEVAKQNYDTIQSLKKDLKKLHLEKGTIVTKRQNKIFDFLLYLESIKTEKEQIILENNNLIKESKALYKTVTKSILNLLKAIHFKEWKTNIKLIEKMKMTLNNFLITKSLYAKKIIFKSIRFEYKTCIKQFKINTRIYNAPFFLSYFYYFAIRNSLLTNRVYEALSSVGLKHEHAHRYPHEFSGGQRQRIVIARALITKPKLIIADEPISALDVSIQSQVINIMKKLSHEQGVTFLFVAHDLSMVNYACNKMIIMHNGKIVEKGDVNQIFNNPIHPYTISLMKAIPELSRIHVDLSAFNDNLNYEKDYNITNVPKFYKVDEEEHEVFSTKGQFSGWVKKTQG
ncbi:MAG: ATP-binding cassette domain-containing protein [Malacoplasma sp.]